jgi:hypothetical protein
MKAKAGRRHSGKRGPASIGTIRSGLIGVSQRFHVKLKPAQAPGPHRKPETGLEFPKPSKTPRIAGARARFVLHKNTLLATAEPATGFAAPQALAA